MIKIIEILSVIAVICIILLGILIVSFALLNVFALENLIIAIIAFVLGICVWTLVLKNRVEHKLKNYEK